MFSLKVFSAHAEVLEIANPSKGPTRNRSIGKNQNTEWRYAHTRNCTDLNNLSRRRQGLSSLPLTHFLLRGNFLRSQFAAVTKKAVSKRSPAFWGCS